MRTFVQFLVVFALAAVFSGCGSDGKGKFQQVQQVNPPAAPVVTVDAYIKQLIFSWDAVPGATHYRLMENPDGHSGFTQTGDDIPAGMLSVTKDIAVHLHDWVNALYVVQACNSAGCSMSSEVSALDFMLDTIGYIKAPSAGGSQGFCCGFSLSAGGDKLAIGHDRSGVYILDVFETDLFPEVSIDGSMAVFSLSADGNTLAVGAVDNSGATGINGDESDSTAPDSGAVYLYRFNGDTWGRQAYIKASNTGTDDSFGYRSIALSADGNTLVVGAHREDSSAVGINGDQSDNSADGSGAAYLFRFDGNDWSQQAYIKASNTVNSDDFGFSVALSADGNTLVVGAPDQDSCATGVNGDQHDIACTFLQSNFEDFGAAYLFRFDGEDWSQQAFIKGQIQPHQSFGKKLALSADGNSLAVSEPSGLSDTLSGARVFRFDGTDWYQEAYFFTGDYGDPASSSDFARAISLSADGDTLALGSGDDSSATGINGDPTKGGAYDSGAVHLFRFDGISWVYKAYVKAPNPEEGDAFGGSVALSADGTTLVASAAGAAYVY